jgi:putative peptide zinc metalloprotease protein
MATLAESLSSSTARSLGVKKRPDLVIERSRYQGQQYWIIKDPVALTYYRFQEEEYAILEMLDGKTSLDELKQRFEKQFAPQKITLEELGRLIGMLHRSHLVIADLPGQGHQLRKRHQEKTKKEWLGKLANLLSIRFKGIDPERILTKLLPWFGWLFTWTGGVIVLGIAFSALLLILVQFDRFQSRLPTFHEFFAAKNWIYLAVSMGICKVLHEFGHGLSCKKFGGECHEMGFMLLVFTPCLYCNVSDSWMLPNKWQRAMIGAAGMYVELLIAGLATFGWWFSNEGMFNYLCLSTIFVCSVSTLLFNANPLMRYDGYYILSDLTEIPNLRQKATSILGRKLGKWCLGFKEYEDPFLPRRHQLFFAFYSIAATAYMWIVSVSILFFLYHVFEGNGLRVFGHLLAIAALVNLLVMPLWRLGKFFFQPGRMEQVKKVRLFITLGIVSALLAAFFLIPLPYRVFAPVEITPRRAASVYVDVSGFLTEIHVQPGQQVVAGQVLAVLINEQLNIQINQLARRVREKDEEYHARLRERSAGDKQAGNEIEALKQQLESATNEYQLKLEDQQRLELRSPIAGTVIAPPLHVDRASAANDRLPQWSGSPLDKHNQGALLERNTLFCQIANPQQYEGVLVVAQQEMDFIRPEQAVEIQLDSLPGKYWEGKLAQVSPEKLATVSKQLTTKTGGEIETKTDEQGQERPINTVYQANVFLEESTGVLRPGMRGRARIHAAPQTLAQRTWRMIQETLNFKL